MARASRRNSSREDVAACLSMGWVIQSTRLNVITIQFGSDTRVKEVDSMKLSEKAIRNNQKLVAKRRAKRLARNKRGVNPVDGDRIGGVDVKVLSSRSTHKFKGVLSDSFYRA